MVNNILKCLYSSPPASGRIISADSDLCGSGTSTLTTITLNNPVGHLNGYLKIIEFDLDWRIINSADKAFVEISSNGGQTWNIVWQRIGIDQRNSHEYIEAFINGEILVRFRTEQPGWNWWWAIDNVRISQDCPITQFYPPYNLKINTFLEPTARVELTWLRGTWVSGTFLIKRKVGLPTDPGSYSTIATVSSSNTNFTDNSVEENQIYTYQLTSNPIWDGGPSNEVTAYIAEGYVPVELVSFSAVKEYSWIELNWETASETNNLGFEIQKRKVYTDNQDSPFGKISFVEGSGTATEPKFYTFRDQSSESGILEYRLKQIDFDGSFEYSNIIEVIIDLPTKFSLEQNYPNPFNPVTSMQYTIGSRQFVTLKIYDLLGKEIAILVNEEKPAGEYEVEFDGSNLSSGIYFYQLKAGSFVDNKEDGVTEMKNFMIFLLLLVLVFTETTTAQFMQWRNLNINSIKHAVVSKSGNIYASSKDFIRRLYKSTNDGDTWTTMISGLPIESIESVGYDTLIFSTTESELYFSFDGGNSYNLNQTFSSRIYSIEFINYIDSSFILLGTANGSVHTSKDFGNSWTSVQVSNSYVLSIKLIQSRLLAATYDGLYYSDDLGQTWQNLVIVQTGERVYDIESDSFGNLYASTGNGKIYKSKDFGNSWDLSLNSISIQLIRFSPENEIFAGNYKSTDQGESWINIIPTTIFDICFKDTITFMVNIDGNLYREDNYLGQNFSPLKVGNKWQYSYSRYENYFGLITINYNLKYKEIIGDTVISGNLYSTITENENINFYRYNNDNRLYKWVESSSSDCVYMDFNLVWGDNFSSCNGNVYVIEDYENKFGGERKWKGFLIPESHGAQQTRYMDSIGYWKYLSYWGYYNQSVNIEIDLINALVTLEDSTFYYSYYHQPDIIFIPDSTVDTLLLNLDFNVDHTYSKFSTNGESRNFIDKVWIEYFYAKQDSVTIKDSVFANISENSTLCNASILLDSLNFLRDLSFIMLFTQKTKH
jgi:hypothetical protein